MELKIKMYCSIIIVVCVILAFVMAVRAEMVRETIIVGGELDYIYVDDTIPPAPPQGVKVLQPGRTEQRFENYAPTGDIRMEDGQGSMVEYDINIDNPSEGGSVEGAYWE